MSKSTLLAWGLPLIGAVVGYVLGGPFIAIGILMLGVILLAVSVLKPEEKSSNDIWREIPGIKRKISKPAITNQNEVEATWKDLAARFEKFIGKELVAHWSSRELKNVGESMWFVLGRSPRVERDQFEAVCKLAGIAVGRFPKVTATLPSEVISEANPLFAWFNFLKHCGELRHLSEVTITTEQNGDMITARGGKIPLVAEVSAKKCRECLYYELSD